MALARDRSSAPAPRIVAISPDDGSAIDLRNPALAAMLSWAVPGLGQLYQGRTFKGRLFMGAILGTFLAGMWLGGGKVVYASWKPGDTRWAFVCQAGAGLVAMPAVVQSLQLNGAARSSRSWAARSWPRRSSPGSTCRGLRRSAGGVRPRHRPRRLLRSSRRSSSFAASRCRSGTVGSAAGSTSARSTRCSPACSTCSSIYDAWAGPLGTPTDEDRKVRSKPT